MDPEPDKKPGALIIERGCILIDWAHITDLAYLIILMFLRRRSLTYHYAIEQQITFDRIISETQKPTVEITLSPMGGNRHQSTTPPYFAHRGNRFALSLRKGTPLEYVEYYIRSDDAPAMSMIYCPSKKEVTNLILRQQFFE